MKLRNFLALMALAFLATGFTSCDDDDDDANGSGDIIVNPTPADSIIAGNYKGKIEMNVGNKPQGVIKNYFSISSQKNGLFSITVPEIAAPGQKSMVIPSFTLEDVNIIVGGENKFTFAIESTGVKDNTTTYAINKFIGSVEGDSLKLTYSITPKGMPMSIDIAFGGIKFNGDYEEDNENNIDLSNNFFGVATINTPAAMGQPASTSNDSTFVTRIIKQSNGKYSVVLPESSETETPKGMSMPTVTVKDLDLTETSKGVFSYSAETLTVKVSANKNAVLSKFNVNVNSVTKKADVSYGIQYGNMPLVIKYDFKTLLKNDFVAGTFMGVNSTIMKGETTPDSMNVAVIELQENGKYTLVLPEKSKSPLSFRGMEMPSNVRLTDLEIAGEGNKFSFSKAEATVQTPAMSIALKDVKGSINGNKFELTYQLKPGKMPFYIDFSYEGGKIK